MDINANAWCWTCGRWAALDRNAMCAPCLDAWVLTHDITHPAVLDGCCGAGGAAHGYALAGFEVWGIDSNPRVERDYLRSGAARFTAASILDVLADWRFARSFDFIHVSPPCQRYSQMTRCRPGVANSYPDLIGPVRELLLRIGRPFVIENVGAARPLLCDPVTLCGQMFNRPVYRHRLFEGNRVRLTAPAATAAGTAMKERRNKECNWPHPVPAARAGHWQPGMYVSVSGHERREPVREAMSIGWMSRRDDVAEAVPPYMTELIGHQVLAQL